MRSYLFLAQGFEEIEALTVVDVMRRAGLDIKTVSITDDLNVAGAHGINVAADLLFGDTDFADAQWLIAPGGLPGAENLHNFGALNTLLTSHAAKGGKVAAICAAPALVLSPLGLLKGLDATCYPGFESHLIANGANYTADTVSVTPQTITANGPASATAFAIAIVAATLGVDTANEVAAGMLC